MSPGFIPKSSLTDSGIVTLPSCITLTVNIALSSGIFSILDPVVYNATLLDTLIYNRILSGYMMKMQWQEE